VHFDRIGRVPVPSDPHRRTYDPVADPDEKQRPIITPHDRVAARIAAQKAAAEAAEAQALARALARRVRPVWIGLACFAGALALCLLAYLIAAVPGAWFPRASAISWVPTTTMLKRGNAVQTAEGVAITAPDAAETALISINTDFRSTDYRALQWDLVDVPPQADVRMLWQSDYAPAKMNSAPVSSIGGRLQPIELVNDPAWVGRIFGIALLVRTPLAQPIYFRGVTAKPMGAADLLRDRLREWLAPERWTGVSINVVPGGAAIQDLPLPPLLAVAALIAIGASLLWLRFTPRLALFPLAVAAIFVAAWTISDLRWQWSLARQVAATRAQYAGKDWRQKHLAAEDGPLFAFIDKARAKIAEQPGRVFMVAGAHYFRDRGAYHLYPYNVFFDPYADTLPPATALHAGDYILVYNRLGVQFDEANKRLRFNDGSVVNAERVVAEPGAALLRIL
jgi:hypothetical protein